MAHIATIDAGAVLGRLPEIVPFDRSLLSGRDIDLLVCCAGFEDRSVAICDALAGAHVRDALIVQYGTNVAENSPATKAFEGQTTWDRLTGVPYQRSTFVPEVRRLLAGLRGNGIRQVVVDLSGMASYVVYRVLFSLWNELPESPLAVYYAEAGDYAPSMKEWDLFYKSIEAPDDSLAIAERYERTYFQSRGIDETYESDVFPGKNIGPLATELVAIPSFSLQRMKAMLAFAETQYNVRAPRVRWFLGQPPDRVRNGWRFEALARLYSVRAQAVGVSTRDFRETVQRLDQIWQDVHTERHLVIANLGSKMQHLGCFLFLTMHDECGLLLCEPREFIANRYSTGIGPQWWLDFATISEVDRNLRSRGHLRFVWS